MNNEDLQKGNSVFLIELDKIEVNPYQPRIEFDQEKIEALADSIRQYGVIQPIVVSRKEEYIEGKGIVTKYQIIAGERRFRASKLAGLKQIPAIIRTKEDTDAEKLELAIIENLQREDLNPVDKAKAFKRLADEFKMTHAEIAKKMGKSRESISNAMRILMLPENILAGLTAGKISEGHTRSLLMLKDRPEEQQELYKRIVEDKLTVRAAEKLARGIATDKIRKKVDVDPEIKLMENKIREKLGTKVSIDQKPIGDGGKLTIEFFSKDDLKKILAVIDARQPISELISSDNKEIEEEKEEEIHNFDDIQPTVFKEEIDKIDQFANVQKKSFEDGSDELDDVNPNFSTLEKEDDLIVDENNQKISLDEFLNSKKEKEEGYKEENNNSNPDFVPFQIGGDDEVKVEENQNFELSKKEENNFLEHKEENQGEKDFSKEIKEELKKLHSMNEIESPEENNNQNSIPDLNLNENKKDEMVKENEGEEEPKLEDLVNQDFSDLKHFINFKHQEEENQNQEKDNLYTPDQNQDEIHNWIKLDDELELDKKEGEGDLENLMVNNNKNNDFIPNLDNQNSLAEPEMDKQNPFSDEAHNEVKEEKQEKREEENPFNAYANFDIHKQVVKDGELQNEIKEKETLENVGTHGNYRINPVDEYSDLYAKFLESKNALEKQNQENHLAEQVGIDGKNVILNSADNIQIKNEPENIEENMITPPNQNPFVEKETEPEVKMVAGNPNDFLASVKGFFGGKKEEGEVEKKNEEGKDKDGFAGFSL